MRSLRARDDDGAHLGMLEADALQRVGELDVDAEVVRVELERVAGRGCRRPPRRPSRASRRRRRTRASSAGSGMARCGSRRGPARGLESFMPVTPGSCRAERAFARSAAKLASSAAPPVSTASIGLRVEAACARPGCGAGLPSLRCSPPSGAGRPARRRAACAPRERPAATPCSNGRAGARASRARMTMPPGVAITPSDGARSSPRARGARSGDRPRRRRARGSRSRCSRPRSRPRAKARRTDSPGPPRASLPSVDLPAPRSPINAIRVRTLRRSTTRSASVHDSAPAICASTRIDGLPVPYSRLARWRSETRAARHSAFLVRPRSRRMRAHPLARARRGAARGPRMHYLA